MCWHHHQFELSLNIERAWIVVLQYQEGMSKFKTDLEEVGRVEDPTMY